MKERTIALNDIPSVAKDYAQKIKGGEIFALIGNLGAGKTTFVKSLAKELKLKKRVTSPTFVLMNAYPLKLKAKKFVLFHLDLYRTKNFKEVSALGLNDFWASLTP